MCIPSRFHESLIPVFRDGTMKMFYASMDTRRLEQMVASNETDWNKRKHKKSATILWNSSPSYASIYMKNSGRIIIL